MVFIPGVFGLGVSFLAQSGKSDLRETIFDDFVAGLEFSLFPEAELFGGLLEAGGDFGHLCLGEGVIINLFPSVFGGAVAVVLGTLSDKEVQVRKLLWGGIFELVDDLNKELVEFLTRDGADFKMVETLD